MPVEKSNYFEDLLDDFELIGTVTYAIWAVRLTKLPKILTRRNIPFIFAISAFICGFIAAITTIIQFLPTRYAPLALLQLLLMPLSAVIFAIYLVVVDLLLCCFTPIYRYCTAHGYDVCYHKTDAAPAWVDTVDEVACVIAMVAFLVAGIMNFILAGAVIPGVVLLAMRFGLGDEEILTAMTD